MSKQIFTYQDFVVEFKQAYNNEQQVGELTLVVNTNVEDVKYVNRECVVVGLPHNYKGEIKVGDSLIVHHNIARVSYGQDGRELKPYLVKNNLYRCPEELVFLFRTSDDQEWQSYGEYCFVKPVENEKVQQQGSIFIPESIQENYIKNTGVVAIENAALSVMGVHKGDKVYFMDFSEHKYELDGQLYYKMKVNRILGLIN